MADSLVLTGVKGVKKHTGTEMLLTRPKRGGDTHSVKEWWRNGVSTVYATCTIFDVTTAAGTVKLVLDTSAGTNVRIDHDGAFNFTFIRPNEIKRGALFTDAMELIEHYVYPAISGGKVMTVTPPGAASRPGGGGGGATTITSVTVSGDETPTVGDTSTYSVAVVGDATPFTYTWGVPVGEAVASGQGTDEITVTWSSEGAGGVTCVVSSDNANFDGNDVSDTLTINIAAPPTPDVTVTIDSVNGTNGYILSGDAIGENATISVTAGNLLSITNNTGSHPLYIKSALGAGNSGQISDGSVTGQGATNGEVLWDTTGVAPGTYYYQCQLHENMNGEIVVS